MAFLSCLSLLTGGFPLRNSFLKFFYSPMLLLFLWWNYSLLQSKKSFQLTCDTFNLLYQKHNIYKGSMYWLYQIKSVQGSYISLNNVYTQAVLTFLLIYWHMAVCCVYTEVLSVAENQPHNLAFYLNIKIQENMSFTSVCKTLAYCSVWLTSFEKTTFFEGWSIHLMGEVYIWWVNATWFYLLLYAIAIKIGSL